MRDTRDYRSEIAAYGRGERTLNDLALLDDGFWQFALAAGARPGRNSTKAPFIAAAADQLLRTQLPPEAAKARAEAVRHALSHPNSRVRLLALRQVSGTLTPDMLDRLRQAVMDRDLDVALEAVHVVSREDSDQGYALLAQVLAATSDARATIAAEELSLAGPKAVPFVAQLLDSPERGVRWRGVACLVRISGEEVLEPLLRALHDDSVDIAWLAADGLLALGPSIQAAVLKSVIAGHISAATARALRHYAEHSTPRAVFAEVIAATQGLGSLSAVPVAVEHALEKLAASHSRNGAATQ
jgi:HEAT repeat protein